MFEKRRIAYAGGSCRDENQSVLRRLNMLKNVGGVGKQSDGVLDAAGVRREDLGIFSKLVGEENGRSILQRSQNELLGGLEQFSIEKNTALSK